MAASSSISNVFTFLLPAKPQAPQFPFSPSLTRFPSPKNHKLGDNLVPLVAHNDHSSSTSSDLSSVMNPSLAHANILFSRSAYNVQVFVDENEPEERLLNRFKREVLRAGVIQECRRRRYFENKQDEKKRRTRDAAKRNRRNRRPPQSRSPMQNKQDVPATKKEEDDDNWDLPEEDLLNF